MSINHKSPMNIKPECFTVPLTTVRISVREFCFSVWTTTNGRKWLDSAFVVAALHSSALLLEKIITNLNPWEMWQLLLDHERDDCYGKITFLEGFFLAAIQNTQDDLQLDLTFGMTEYLWLPRSRNYSASSPLSSAQMFFREWSCFLLPFSPAHTCNPFVTGKY